jgi:hypothetical protein
MEAPGLSGAVVRSWGRAGESFAPQAQARSHGHEECRAARLDRPLSAARAEEACSPERNPLITLEPTIAAIIRDVLTGCVYDGSSRHAHRVTPVREAQVVLHLAMVQPGPLSRAA